MSWGGEAASAMPGHDSGDGAVVAGVGDELPEPLPQRLQGPGLLQVEHLWGGHHGAGGSPTAKDAPPSPSVRCDLAAAGFGVDRANGGDGTVEHLRVQNFLGHTFREPFQEEKKLNLILSF